MREIFESLIKSLERVEDQVEVTEGEYTYLFDSEYKKTEIFLNDSEEGFSMSMESKKWDGVSDGELKHWFKLIKKQYNL